MLALSTIADEILELKNQRKAILLAHHYQVPEIQELADVVGDSLELARKAREFSGDVISFCGVWFMAETAKVLNRERIVVVPDRQAGCSLVDSCTAEGVRAFRTTHPDHCVVAYINTSIEVKAESDILCTSRNAVKVVESIPRERPVLFLPDQNLGNWVKRQTGRENIDMWPGSCIVHATFPAKRLMEARIEHPAAKVVAHPECPEAVLAQADFVGSTSALIEWCAASEASEFIVMTESGVRFTLGRVAPGKRFHFIANENCNCSECPYMKYNTLEKVRDSLRTLEPRVELSTELMDRALLPLERMFAVK
jgi:quinolinate synthase